MTYRGNCDNTDPALPDHVFSPTWKGHPSPLGRERVPFLVSGNDLRWDQR